VSRLIRVEPEVEKGLGLQATQRLLHVEELGVIREVREKRTKRPLAH
jgi:hypothetical protein